MKASRQGSNAGLLQQYIEAKMAKQVTAQFLNSVIAGSFSSKRFSKQSKVRTQTERVVGSDEKEYEVIIE